MTQKTEDRGFRSSLVQLFSCSFRLHYIVLNLTEQADRLVRKLVEICRKIASLACDKFGPGRNSSPNSSSMLALYIHVQVYYALVAGRLRFGESSVALDSTNRKFGLGGAKPCGLLPPNPPRY